MTGILGAYVRPDIANPPTKAEAIEAIETNMPVPQFVEWWIVIERDHGMPDLVVGWYGTEDEAIAAMNDSLLIQGFVEENCLECSVQQLEVVVIDKNDPDHHGRMQG